MSELTLNTIHSLLTNAGLITIPFDEFTALTDKVKIEFQRKLAQEPEYVNIIGRITPVDLAAKAQIKSAKLKDRLITEEDIYKTLANHYGMVFKQVDPANLDFSFISKFFSKQFAIRNVTIPLFESAEEVTIAVGLPPSQKIQNAIQSSLYKKAHYVLCTKTSILNIINQYWHFESTIQKAKKKAASSRSDSPSVQNMERLINLKSDKDIEDNEEGIVRAVEYIFKMALDLKASDIHIEPKRESSLVRMRIDGILHTTTTLPVVIHPSVITRIKITAGMNIAEKRKPQDGRIKVQNQDDEIEFRVSSLPTAFGEKIVIRIFDAEMSLSEPEELGFKEDEYNLFHKLIHKPSGVLYITGPTGSGKTTTLYSTLKMLADEAKNIVTIEDPIEMVYDHLNQVSVNHKIELDFEKVLRAILRQDPDIIMVGETRDGDTAKSVIQAAITGHLVFSTLHTNDSASALARLTELGVQPFLISSAVNAVIAQRLVRRICANCHTSYTPTEEESRILQNLYHQTEEIPLFHGTGCAECRNTGYKGRTGIFEILVMDEMLISLVKANADANELRDYAVRNGLKTLQEQAMTKAMEGITTISEAIRVTGFPE